MNGAQCQRYGEGIGAARCKRKATHDLGWESSVQVRDDTADPQFDPKSGEPVMDQSVIRVITGSTYCKSHARSWADDLNRKRLDAIVAAEEVPA